MNRIRWILLMLCVPLLGVCQETSELDYASDSSVADGEVLTLSLLEAEDYALAYNRSLQNADIDYLVAKAQRWQSIAGMLPQIDAQGTYTNFCGYEMDFGQFKFPMPSQLSGTFTAQLGLNGQAIVGALLGTLAMDMQNITYYKDAAVLKGNVIKSYTAVVVTKEILSLLDSSYVNLQKIAYHTRRLADVGSVESTEADLLDVKVLALANSIKSNERSLEVANNSLRMLLNVDPNTFLALTDGLDSLLSVETVLNVLAQQFVLENNYDYQLAQQNVKLAKRNKQLAWWAYGPTLGFQYQYNGTKYYGEGGMRSTPPNLVALNLSVPIWSSGKRAAGVREKKLLYEKAQNTLSETQDQLGIQNQQLHSTLASNYETFVNEKQNLAVTEHIFQNMGKKYNHGAASAMELTTASNDLLTAQSTYVQAVLNVVNAQVELITFLNNVE